MSAPRTQRSKPFVETFVKSSFVKARPALLVLLLLTAAHAALAQQRPAATPTPRKAQAATETANASAASSPTPSATPSRAALTGRVVGDSGEPLADVAVALGVRGVFRAAPPSTVSADENGNFKFEGLAPGLYEVSASQPGFVAETDPLTGRPYGPYRPGDNVTLRLVKGGVITGAVFDGQGQPVASLGVRAVRVRDLDGGVPPFPFPATGEDRTDDRGVYRIYGLRPGVYVVYAGGFSTSPFIFAGYGEAATFYPSGTRDTAAEVSVRAGQEVGGIDVRLREDPARRVSGTVDSQTGAFGEFGVSVNLNYASTTVPAGTSFVNTNTTGNRSFMFDGVADGEYDLQAIVSGREGITLASTPQRVSVRGADITGLRLTLTPLASASGTIRFEPVAPAPEACKKVRASQLPQETLVVVDAATPTRVAPGGIFSRLSVAQSSTPDESGAFTVRPLEGGRYRLSVRLFDEAFYVRSIQTPAPAPTRAAGATRATAATASAVSRDVFDVKPGQQFSGLLVRVAEGAASLGGSVTASDPAAAAALPQMRVHLVPQERERAEDTLHYYETPVAADGTFSFKNLAPGRYLVLARPAVMEAGESVPRPAALNATTRAALRREAESANTTVELQPCQRTNDFVLHYPTTK